MMTYLLTMIFFAWLFFTLVYPFGMLKGAMILTTGAVLVIGTFMADGNVMAALLLCGIPSGIALAINKSVLEERERDRHHEALMRRKFREARIRLPPDAPDTGALRKETRDAIIAARDSLNPDVYRRRPLSKRLTSACEDLTQAVAHLHHSDPDRRTVGAMCELLDNMADLDKRESKATNTLVSAYNKAPLGDIRFAGRDADDAEVALDTLNGLYSACEAAWRVAVCKAVPIDKNLAGWDMRGADLAWMDMSDANLQGAKLEEARLCGTNLSRADLTGAILCDANLARANLEGAVLTGANLAGANLTGARLPESVPQRP